MPNFAGGLIHQRGIEHGLSQAHTVPDKANRDYGEVSQLSRSERSQLRVEFVADRQRLNELAEDWRALWQMLPDATPFQSPDWLLPWWTHYGEGRLLTFAFWSGNNLAGIAPLYTYEADPNLGRQVFLIGTGNTDYLDVLYHPDVRQDCADTTISEIEKRAPLWDICNFQRLRPTSPLLHSAGDRGGFRTEVRSEEPCPILDLQRADLAAPMLKKARYYLRKLREAHTVEIEQATELSLDEFFAALENLHERRWRAKGSAGVLAEHRDRSFHREAARLLLKAGVLHLHGLRANGSIIGAIHTLRHQKRAYYYLSGFDPEYASFSIGTVLVAYAIEKSLNGGCVSFDFLKGRESYKYRWGARDQTMFATTIRKAS